MNREQRPVHRRLVIVGHSIEMISGARPPSYQPADEVRSAPRPRDAATVGDMTFHDIKMTSITGDQVDFADYEGQLALVVNVASA